MLAALRKLQFYQSVIPAQGVAGVSHSMQRACVRVGLCKSQRALQAGIHFKYLSQRGFSPARE